MKKSTYGISRLFAARRLSSTTTKDGVRSHVSNFSMLNPARAVPNGFASEQEEVLWQSTAAITNP
jgi:hypothetical protein